MYCNTCATEKPNDEFYKGYKTICKSCKRSEQKARYHHLNDGKEKMKRGRPRLPEDQKKKYIPNGKPRGRPRKPFVVPAVTPVAHATETVVEQPAVSQI